MSRHFKLFPVALLSLGIFGAACALGLLAHLSETAHASKIVPSPSTLRKPPERVIAVPPAAAISQQQLLQAHALATLPLTSPARWQRPSLAAVLAQTTPQPPPPSPDQDPGAAAGSYGTITPNDIGIPNPASHLLGTLQNRLCLQYPRSVQQEQNIALLLASPEDEIEAYFTLHVDSPGWYLIAFHLGNAHTQPCTIHTRVLTGWPLSPQVLIDDTRTVAPEATAVVPTLVEITQSGNFRLALDPYAACASVTGLLIFHALTVDKIG